MGEYSATQRSPRPVNPSKFPGAVGHAAADRFLHIVKANVFETHLLFISEYVVGELSTAIIESLPVNILCGDACNCLLIKKPV